MNPAHEQIPLFGAQSRQGSSPRPPAKAPLARNADPLSSHVAAEEVAASGRRDSQKREILEWLRSHAGDGPVTSMELARSAGLDRYVVARRLPDLERDGLVRRCAMRECGVSGRPAITWRTTEGIR